MHFVVRIHGTEYAYRIRSIFVSGRFFVMIIVIVIIVVVVVVVYVVVVVTNGVIPLI